MTIKGSLDCGACRQPFDVGPRRPKVLPCGHTCCRGCLLGRETGVRCPEDNTTFVGTADAFVDNLYLISAIDRDSHPQRTSESRWLVPLELAARRLQEELAALPDIRSQVLAALNSSVDRVLRQQLQVLQCLARLRLASGTLESSWQQHRQEAHRLLEAEEPQRQGLRQELRLARGRRLAARAALELRSLPAAAEAELQLEEQPALRLAAALLRQQGDLPGVQYKEEAVRLPRCYLSGMSLSNAGWKKDKALLLETSTKFVRFSSRLYCDGDPAWSLALLHRHSATLTYLRLDCARLEHIAALWELTALEELEISIYERESRATETHSGQPLQWPPLGPSKARRLWKVMKFNMPWSVAAVLLAAHRHSLLDVYLWPYGIHMTSDQLEATAAILRQCDMYRLRSLGLAFMELAEEEADVLRAALPEGCHLGYRVKVEKPPKPAPRNLVVRPETDVFEEAEDDIDIGFGLFD